MAHDPIAKLMEDHQRFLETVASFKGDLKELAATGPVSERLPRRVAEFAHFLSRDVDRIHGQQEERGLFPVLGRYLPIEGGPIGVMVGEHEALRGFQTTLERSGRVLESDREAAEAAHAVAATYRSVGELLALHVLKEDSVLFPMAYQLLSPRELEEIAQVFDEVETAAGKP